MNRRFFASLGVLAAVTLVASLGTVSLAGQAKTGTAPTKAAEWTPPQTAWGAPDLQCVWDYRSITPLERPDSLAWKQVLTDEEAAEFEQAENRRSNRDLVDSKRAALVIRQNHRAGWFHTMSFGTTGDQGLLERSARR